jgi:hypothetical protein
LDDIYNPVAAFISALDSCGETRATRKVCVFAGVAVMRKTALSISQ